MTWVYQGFEVAATLCESVIIFCTISGIAGEKNQGKRQFLYVLLTALPFSGIIFILNSFNLFSFLTLTISFAAAIMLSKFASKGPLLLRSLACVLAYLVIHAIDYIMLFSFCFALEKPVIDTQSFNILLNAGPPRCLYLALDKLLDVFLFIVLRKALLKLQRLQKRYCWMLLAVSLSIYITMTLLIGLIMGHSLFAMQTAIMLSWIFSSLCVFSVIALFLLTANYQAEKQTNELLHLADKLMTENYQHLYANQQALARQIHDFNHHVKALQILAAQEGARETMAYTQSLLKSTYVKRVLCACGNNIIDAIINCKAVEAEELSIAFSFNVQLPQKMEVDPVDICAILSNQIENAFDACKKVANLGKRSMSVDIWHKNEKTVFFRVANYVEENPFDTNPRLQSTKAATSDLHGLGLKNISDTAARYGGAANSTYQDHCFISTVFLSLSTF